MDASRKEYGDVVLLVEAARRVRQKNGHVDVAGKCRDISLATALCAIGVETSVCVCYGKAFVDGESHNHWWLRSSSTIVDPTADQFGLNAPLVVPEMARDGQIDYQCEFFFQVPAARIRSLAGWD